MKQIIVLEPHEVKTLMRGKTLMIQTQAGDIGLQFMAGEASEAAALSSPKEKKRKVFACDICGQSTNKNTGRSFSGVGSVIRHKAHAHPDWRRQAKQALKEVAHA
jgi:hypothetical protein